MSTGQEASVAHGFFRSWRRHPQRPAFGFSDRDYTYDETMGLVQAIRRQLDAVAPPEEKRIAVVATRDIHAYAAVLAILASGRAYVPINPHNPPERSWSCLQQAAVRTLLQTGPRSALSDWLSEHRHRLNVLDCRQAPGFGAFAEPATVIDTDLAYLLFTSGSTGTPKGVPITHANLGALLRAQIAIAGYDFRATDRFLQMAELTFDLSVMPLFTAITLGACCHVVADGGVGFLNVSEALQKGRITVAVMVPAVLSFLERYFDEIHLPDIRYSLFCGEPLGAALVEKWRRCTPNGVTFNLYGPTEATVYCTAYPVPTAGAKAYHGVLSIGRAIPGMRLAIIDERLQPVRAGEKGELCLIGPQVTDRYWEDPEKTRRAFVELAQAGGRAYRTGDLAFERDGDYFHCGRIDHQVKIDGFRVEIGEIEHHARQLPETTNAAVVAQVSGSDTILHLFLETSRTLDREAIAAVKAALGTKVPSYMLPRRVHAIGALPLSQNGKIDRQRLLAMVEGKGG